MKIERLEPPREFLVGHPGRPLALRHAATVDLEADEQLTFRTDRGAEYDVVRKSWGFYATPSLNGRLRRFGLRSALVRSGTSRYLLLVELGCESDFAEYLAEQEMVVEAWLDEDPPDLTPASGADADDMED